MITINIWIALFVILLTPLSLFAAKWISKNAYTSFKLQSEKRAEQIQREAEDGFEFATSKAKQAETDITNVIKEKPVVPASSFKSSYSAQKAPLDASRQNGYNTNLPAGVNDSKTIYTDDLGRLHFFGKGNIVKE